MRNLVENPECSCGFRNESPAHYFFECPKYDLFRYVLINTLLDCNIIANQNLAPKTILRRVFAFLDTNDPNIPIVIGCFETFILTTGRFR